MLRNRVKLLIASERIESCGASIRADDDSLARRKALNNDTRNNAERKLKLARAYVDVGDIHFPA